MVSNSIVQQYLHGHCFLFVRFNTRRLICPTSLSSSKGILLWTPSRELEGSYIHLTTAGIFSKLDDVGKNRRYTIGMKWPSGWLSWGKIINKHKIQTEFQLLICDGVVVMDCRIPPWHPLFPLYTKHPFISKELVVWERKKRFPRCP